MFSSETRLPDYCTKAIFPVLYRDVPEEDCSTVVKTLAIDNNVLIRSDTGASIHFAAHFVQLFEGSVYFFENPGDIQNGWIGYKGVRQ